MSDEDLALSAANYSPPQAASSNSDVNVQAMVAAAVADALAKARAADAAASAPRVVSPEEAARAAIDNHGHLLGVDERLHELYAIVHLLATKVGI